jgi:hypothetical protein
MKKLLGAAIAIAALALMVNAPVVHADPQVSFLHLYAPQQAQLGDAVSLDATVLAPGHVDFVDLSVGGDPVIAGADVGDDGHAVATISTLTLGAHDIQAILRGDPDIPSNIVTVTITKVISAIDATPVLLRVSSLTLYLGGLNAVLHRADNGAPLANRTLVFSAKGAPICITKTGSDGKAGCVGLVPALLGLGYQVDYGGDTLTTAATGAGGLIG